MKKILVVEDDEVERELVRMTLEREGYRVVTAENCPGEGQSCATFAPGECVQMIASRSESA